MSIGRTEERILKRIALDYEMWFINSDTLDETLRNSSGANISHYITDIIITTDSTTPINVEIAPIGTFWVSTTGSVTHSFNAPVRLVGNAALIRTDVSTTAATNVKVQGFTGPTRFDN